MRLPGSLAVEPLDNRHDRKAFNSGAPELDEYLARRAGQDTRRRIARVFVCSAASGNEVLGFYTLSALSLDFRSLPAEFSRKLPRQPVPCALIGRLAVAGSMQGQGLGRLLLADAVKRARHGDVAVHALVVDARDDNAKRFYERFGFVTVTDNPARLLLPLGATKA